MRWDWIGAIDMARRFGARIPNCRIDALAAQCWVDRVEALPMAQQQGRLAAAIAEANRYVGPPEQTDRKVEARLAAARPGTKSLAAARAS